MDKTLSHIMYGISLLEWHGDRNTLVHEITTDSRNVSAGSLFIAISGIHYDGHNFIDDVIQNGAIAILCEHLPKKLIGGVSYVVTDNTSKALGHVAANFYDHPSKKMQVIGVTGTNGKTTIATLLYQLFSSLGYATGLLSTVENRIKDRIYEAKYTTPDAISLHKMLALMCQAGCTHAFMEVSSHALVQGRVNGVDFVGAIFSNISHDHLDYHGTFDAYIAAKKLLFDSLSEDAFALVNCDDKRGQIMLQNTRAGKFTYSLKSVSDFKAKVLNNSLQGLELSIDETSVYFKLVGLFNAYNLLAVYSTAVLLGTDKLDTLTRLSYLSGAKGRFQLISNQQDKLAIVDYAHTPDALENVLKTITEVRTRNEKLITVVGCGGDRDKTKRPKMASIANQLSDVVILTSDNPRSESPSAIIDEMIEGIPLGVRNKIIRIEDRKEAIRTACVMSLPKDIILVAGKGHENYQEIKGEKFPFDDVEILLEFLNVPSF